MSPSNSNILLRSLIKANNGILKQKISLLDILQAKYGADETSKLFQRTCPIVQASIGQHYRHSMDHIELAALTASTCGHGRGGSDVSDHPLTLRYDLRIRGGTLEKDVNETRKRIMSVMNIFQEMGEGINLHNSNISNNGSLNIRIPVESQRLNASFILTSDTDNEIELQSTVGRELGFCAHHAIHHMAMVKVIAIQTLNLEM